jgi:hypothetical protein
MALPICYCVSSNSHMFRSMILIELSSTVLDVIVQLLIDIDWTSNRHPVAKDILILRL